MLHIIWGILKILGFLLLAVFLLILTILLLVLFVPIRYQALADLHGELKAEGKVTWLLNLLSVAVAFRDKQLEYSVKVLGFTLLKSQPADSIGNKAAKKSAGRKATKEPLDDFEEDEDLDEELLLNGEVGSGALTAKGDTGTLPEKQSVEKTEAASSQLGAEKKTASEDVKKQNAEVPGKAEEQPEKPQEDSSKEKKGIGQKISELIQKIKSVIEGIRDKIRNIRQTIENIKKTVEKIKKFLYAEATQKTLRHGKKELGYLLRHIGPRTLQGNVRFGLEDPGSTGQILGYLSILQGLTGSHLQVEGVFDEKVTEGSVFLKGHIRLCHFVKILLSMILDKNVRITIRRLMKLRG